MRFFSKRYTCSEALPRTIAPIMAAKGVAVGLGGGLLVGGIVGGFMLDNPNRNPNTAFVAMGLCACLGALTSGAITYATWYMGTNLFLQALPFLKDTKIPCLASSGIKPQLGLFTASITLGIGMKKITEEITVTSKIN